VREGGDGKDRCEDEALVVHCGGAEVSRSLGKAGIWKSVHGSDRTGRLVEGGKEQMVIVGCTVVMFIVRKPSGETVLEWIDGTDPGFAYSRVGLCTNFKVLPPFKCGRHSAFSLSCNSIVIGF
jgi:hypothetical protein